MIATLRGSLLDHGDGWCVVEAGGVGYEVHVSAHTLASLPSSGEVRLRTRLIVREDAHLLFGFTEADELRLFDLLIEVNGVSPRIALSALSGLAPPALARAIRDENIGALVAVKGVGRKIAERLVVELRDKLEFLPVVGPAARGREAALLPKSERYDDAVAALVTLGYSSAQAQEAVRKAGADSADLSLEDIVKRSLARLARPAMVQR